MPEPLHFVNLNESNYAEWLLYMQSTLIKKGLWKVVEGSETCPLSSPNSKALQCMHHAQGFATWMTLCQRFNMMTKHADQSMSSWIADVQQAMFHLQEVRYNTTAEDKILVLTQGLPPFYDPFIISLDTAIAANNTTADSSISLEVVRAQLLNEESHQHATQLVQWPQTDWSFLPRLMTRLF
ncbi:hypothetical protein J3A83DRAFT_4088071 [Scleroderma citrinum]